MMCRFSSSISVFVLILQIILPSKVVSGVLLINEVYYDHPGSDEGWEFVEILNTGDRSLSLEGWSLVSIDGNTGAASLLWTAPGRTLIDSSGFLLIGGENVVPSGEYRLTGRIENGPDCVALLEGSRIVDMVGYGVIELQGLYEGRYAADVPAGRSLARRPDGNDTDDNFSDFVSASPSPGIPNFYEYDLAVERPAGNLLVCQGSGTDISVTVVNRGLVRLEGVAKVVLLADDGSYLSSLDVDISLSPGEGSETSLYLTIASYSPERLFIAIDLPGDTNDENDSLLVTTAVSPGDVVINELMPRPSEDGSEWIEIFNRSGEWIDISGWVLSDKSGTSGSIPCSTGPVSPGSFLVLAEDPGAFFAVHHSGSAEVVALEGRWPRLNDSGEVADVLALADGDGRLVDQIEYGGIYGEERGRSLERFSPDVCSAYPGGIWLSNATWGRSSPGEVNSTLTERLERPGGVSLNMDCLSLKDGGRLVISGTALAGESGVRISIYGMNGTRVRRLYACSGGARSFGCGWDGKDDSGRPVHTGLYICVIEFLGQGGVLCRRVKECVAVYAGA